MTLLTGAGDFDHAAIMREAHKQFRAMRVFGWSWSRCLSFAWAMARAMREAERIEKAA